MLIFYDVEVKKSFDLSDIERKGMTDRIPPSRLWKGQDLMLRLLLFGRQVYLKYSMDEMSVYAAQASFFIIMAAFPFFMVLLALIQVAPMIHEADLLRFLLPAIPGRFQGLLIYLLDSLHSDSPAALISVTALAAVWSAAKGMLGIEKGLNRVFGVTSPRNYILRRALCSVYTLAFSLMCDEPCAPRIRKLPAGDAVKMVPGPVLSLRDDLPGTRTCDVYHADDLFHRHLHGTSAPEALDLRPDPGSHVFRRRMGTHFPGIFRLLPVFRHIRCHVRKFDCGDPFYAVALCLDLHPVCGGGDQLVFAVL